jgi:hypothetical protein
MPWFITRRGVLLAALLAILSVGWGAFSSVLPEPVKDIAVALFVILIAVAVVVAVNAQSKRMAEEWRRGEEDE